MKGITIRSLLALPLVGLMGLVGSGVANAEHGLQTRPFHVSAEADFVTVDTCQFGAPLQVITGTGHATHLGRFEIEGTACLSDPTSLITWTAANGDAITIEYVIEIGEIGLDGSASIAFPATSVTGTGRFAQVSFGEGDVFAGTVWFADISGESGHLEAGIDGTITYDASDRAR